MPEVIIALLRKEDMPAFRSYIDQSFHEKYILKDDTYLEWQYDGICVAKVRVKIVGHLGYKDILYKIKSGTKIVRVLMNFYVSEPYRIFGVGAMLAKKVFETKNYTLVLGFNPPTDKLGDRLRSGWWAAGYLKRYLSVLRPHDFFLHFVNDKALKDIFVNYAKKNQDQQLSIKEEIKTDATFDAFWKDVRVRYSVTVERDRRYLDWRFFEHPLFKYRILTARDGQELLGFLIYRIETDCKFVIARVVDFVAAERAEKALLSTFLDKAKQEGAHAADFFFSGTMYNQAFVDSGFFKIEDTALKEFPIYFSPVSYKRSYINVAYDFDVPLTNCFFTKADGDQDRPNPH